MATSAQSQFPPSPSTRRLLTRAGGFIGHGASDAPGLLGRIPTGIGCFVDLIVGVVASSHIILFGLGDKNVAQPDPRVRLHVTRLHWRCARYRTLCDGRMTLSCPSRIGPRSGAHGTPHHLSVSA